MHVYDEPAAWLHRVRYRVRFRALFTALLRALFKDTELNIYMPEL